MMPIESATIRLSVGCQASNEGSNDRCQALQRPYRPWLDTASSTGLVGNIQQKLVLLHGYGSI